MPEPQLGASPHFTPETEFYRVATNATYDSPALFQSDNSTYTAEYLDIDGDGTGDIIFSFDHGSVRIPSPNWSSGWNTDSPLWKQKTDGSTQYSQYGFSKGTPFGYTGDLASEPWESGDDFDESIFTHLDTDAAEEPDRWFSWTTTNNSQLEDNVYYFANDDKSVVTRVIFDDTTPESAKYNSWTTIPQKQDNSDSETAIDFNYKLTRKGASETLESLAVLGQGVDESSLYNLEITASSLLDGYDIESTDITLKFNPTIFKEISTSDVAVGTSLPVKNSVEINNDQGTIRIAAASLSNLNKGAYVTPDTVLASFTLDFDENSLSTAGTKEDGSLEVSPLVFDLDVNHDETILSRSHEDGTNFENREIKSLHELGAGIKVDGTKVKLYKAGINITELNDGLVLGTNRIIGSNQGFTNLIRSGDTVEATTTWLNSGNTDANNIRVTAKDNVNASLKAYEFKDGINSIKGGQYINGEFDQSNQESLELTAEITVSGAAGNVLNVSDGLFQLQADDSDIFTNQKGSSNLITFQGDLNYDGRVSMKDLAFLNAGAARQQLVDSTDENGDPTQIASEASYARDVDADFNGRIDLADLSVLDADWGKSLHDGTSGGFTGSSDTFTMQDLEAQGAADWDNAAFLAQNAIEANDAYIGSLETAVAAGDIGADSGNTPDPVAGAADQHDPLIAK